jgi:peptidoglycan/xylan/chitin deacetylase (PgdA/CDA1 family)
MSDQSAVQHGPSLSVVVPTYQRRDLLARTLSSILEQTIPTGCFEVVVVVDGSTDGTLEMLSTKFANPSLRVLGQANAGPAVARNAGIAAAKGELILLVDDDIICPPGLLAAHLKAHAGQPPGVVFGPIFGIESSSTAAELTRLSLESYYKRMRDEWHPDSAPIAYVAPNSSLPRSAFLAAGGFDVRFGHALEDADLGLRLRAAGMPFTYLADVPAYQIQTKASQGLAIRDGGLYGRAEVLLCRVHPGQRRHSFFGGLAEGGFWRRTARKAIACFPLTPDWLLRMPFEVVDRLPAKWLRRERLWLLSKRTQVARLRAATAAAGGWQPSVAEFGQRCPALLYHHVGPQQPGMPSTLTTTPARFERQMRYLRKRGFSVIAASCWLDWIESGRPLPPKPVILTFDDGYADLAEHAFPVLEKYGFGATVFVVSGRIGATNDWDKGLGIASVPLLDEEQLFTWSKRGIEIGAHSRSHASLDIQNDRVVEEEISKSQTDLEALLGQPVRTFAYPFGKSSSQARHFALRTYGLAFGCTEGVNTLASDLSWQFRTMVQPSDSLLDIELRARLGFSPINRVRARLRIRSRVRQFFGFQ